MTLFMVGYMDGLWHWQLGSQKAKQLQIKMALSQNLGNPKSSTFSWFPYISKWQYDRNTPHLWTNFTIISMLYPKID